MSPRSAGADSSPPMPLVKSRYSSRIACMSATSARIASTSGLGGSSASCRRSRVSGVRRSWLTPASIWVRCSIWRSMRARMRRKAWAAWRTSAAPEGRKSGASWPRPNRSAACASRSIGLAWLRM